MARKTVSLSKTGIGSVPTEKPILYAILTDGGRPNYVGAAKKGRAWDRLLEHLPGARDAVSGVKVVIEQTGSIAEARKKEAALIGRVHPKHNAQGRNDP